MRFTYLTLAAVLMAGPESDPWKDFWEKSSELKPKDDAALLKLADWCDERNFPGGAKQCYEIVVKRKPDAEARPTWCEAAFRLAKLEIAAKRYERAAGIIEDLLSTCRHEPKKCLRDQALELRDSALNERARMQLVSFARGDKYLASKPKPQWKQAREAFEEAWKLLPEGAFESAYIPRDTILRRLAECQRQLDEEFAASKVKRERGSVVCGNCDTGFTKCRRCGGTGEVKSQENIVGPRRPQSEMVQCGGPRDVAAGCRGARYNICGECYGLGACSEGITSKEKETRGKILDKIATATALTGTLGAALEQVNRAVLRDVKDGATLSYLRSIKDRYALSTELRRALGPFPPSSTDEASRLWEKTKKAEKDMRARINFLLGYACELSDYIDRYDMLRLMSSKKPDFNFAAWKSLLATGPVSPELIAAFPDGTRKDWTVVQGILESFDPAGEKGLVKLQGGSDVQFFVWTPEARADLRSLANHQWSGFIGGLPETYPFDLGSKLGREATSRKDHVIRLAGRFLRNRLGSPPNWFEVWRYEIGLSRTQEEARIALARPIEDLRLSPAIPVARVARFLRDWRDLEVVFDGVSDETAVEFTVRDCPIGLLLDEIARSALGAEWYYQPGKVVFCRRAPPTVSADLGAVLRELKKLPRGELQVRRGATAETPGVAGLPEDPAGLRVVFRRCLETMEYDAAERCLEALTEEASGDAGTQALSRRLAMARLFHGLTGRTPVSKLVGAAELATITYRKEQTGEVSEPVLLNVLGKGTDSWRVQEAYGIEFTIKSTHRLKAEHVSGQEWRARKEQRLVELEREAQVTSSKSKASKLFLLAIFAKTHGLPGKGTSYLKQAMSMDDFEDVLSLCFPERLEEARSLWMQAAGRKAPPRPEAPLPPQEAVTAEAPTHEPEPMPPGLPPEELLARAKHCIKSGYDCYRKALEGRDAQRLSQRAQKYFDEAQKALERYREARPGDAEAVRLNGIILQYRSDLLKGIGGLFDS